MDGLITTVETFYHGDYEKQSEVLNDELHNFKDQAGHFAKPVAMAGCKDYDFNPGIKLVQFCYLFDYFRSAVHTFKLSCANLLSPYALVSLYVAKWWGNYGTQVPTLQKKAIRILSLTSNSSSCERNWSCFKRVSLPTLMLVLNLFLLSL